MTTLNPLYCITDIKPRQNDVTMIVTVKKYFITTNVVERITKGAWLSMTSEGLQGHRGDESITAI